MTERRICFVGDSLTAGTGDSDFLGWPGRLCAAEAATGHAVTMYNLGIRAETTADMRPRWRAECAPRLPDTVPGAVVFCFGVNDAAHEETVGIRVPLERSCANARAMIAEARAWRPTLWIGPMPTVAELQPLRPATGQVFTFDNGRTRELSQAYAAEAADLGVSYLDVFDTLAAESRWARAQQACDGVHPRGRGYAVVADLVGAWPAWRALLDG